MENTTTEVSRNVTDFYERQIVAVNNIQQLDNLKDRLLDDARITSHNRAYLMGCVKTMAVVLVRVSGIREFASQVKDNERLIDIILLEAVKKFEGK